MAKRTLVGHSHDGRYSYWRDRDFYIYQFNELTQLWQGWLCSLEAWERSYSKCEWVTLHESRRTNPEVEAEPVLLDDSVTEV